MPDNPLTPISSGGVGFLRRLFGPAASELGEVLADRVRAYRAKNLQRILTKAEKKLEGRLIEELPLRFSIPLLEKASLEDDDALVEMWANLLADAGKEIREEHYLMQKVLSSITPGAAELLDYIVGEFHTKEDWYNELEWEEDWLRDLEKFVLKEIEPSLHEYVDTERHSDLARKVCEFPHDKPFWVFRVELPLILEDMKSAIDEGADPETYGMIVMPISYENPSLQILEREQLVERRKHEMKLPYGPLRFSFAAATSLGVELLRICQASSEEKPQVPAHDA